jgi:hypothetical protein
MEELKEEIDLLKYRISILEQIVYHNPSSTEPFAAIFDDSSSSDCLD